jgi:3-methyladenine DNA glycosylase Tag
MSDPRLALSAGNVEYRLEPKWLEACAFHKAQPCGLTDFTEVAGALGENQPKRHPFFAGQPITSATVNPFTRHGARWESGNDRLHCDFEAFYTYLSHQPSFRGPYTVTAFKTIRARAEKRKGGPKALARLLPARPNPKALARRGDDRILAEMTRRVFCAGFAWSVIENKWPGFEKAFAGFKPGPLSLKPDEFWDDLMKDTGIVRNGAKIMSVRANASFVRDIAREHGSFGKFLANWPSSDQAGLLELLSKRGSRLGGNTGQMMLRFIGWDGFVTSRDVVLCLRDAGLDIAETVTSKRDLAKVQAQFNAWAEESDLSYVQISRICAMSVGENYAAEKLASMTGGDE